MLLLETALTVSVSTLTLISLASMFLGVILGIRLVRPFIKNR